MTYRCSKCGKVVKRDWKTKTYKNRIWFRSFCDEKGIMTRMYKVKNGR